MKKRIKRIAILLGIVVLLAAGVAAYNFYPMLFMSPVATGPVGDSEIIALNNGANSLYFLSTDDGYMVVDLGSGSEEVEDALAELDIDPQDVYYILLTHSDYDHVGSLPVFPNATIYMNVSEKQMIDGTTKRNLISRNQLPEELGAHPLVVFGDDHLLELGGREVLSIAAPGHTPGSMAFVVDGHYLFTGDAFQVRDGLVSPHPFTMDEFKAQTSIRKLFDAMDGVELVFTAHYGVYTPEELAIKIS